MKRQHTTLIVALLASGTLAACSSNPTRQEVGIVTGAVVGGIVGSTLTGGSSIGTIGGAAAGGYFGNRIGDQLDRK